MQSFPISNKDVLFVSNTPAAEMQKFMTLVFSAFDPLATAIQISK